MTAQGNHIFAYFFEAGFVVKCVMLILVSASIVSWTIILQRATIIRDINRQLQEFLEKFNSCDDLRDLYLQLEKAADKSGVRAIFLAGFKSFSQIHQNRKLSLASINRAMQIPYAREAGRMEQNLSILASIGSVAPYIGLFGTVWGIMGSLQMLGQAKQATITMIAPGISEALVATALGLFAAIPAVIAFNRISASITVLLNRYQLFQDELLYLFERQLPLQSQQEEVDNG